MYTLLYSHKTLFTQISLAPAESALRLELTMALQPAQLDKCRTWGCHGNLVMSPAAQGKAPLFLVAPGTGRLEGQCL